MTTEQTFLRLSDVNVQKDNTPFKEKEFYRLSDVERVSNVEIPLEDKNIGENYVEGLAKGFASTPQIVGNVLMAYGDDVRERSDKAEKQGLIFGVKPIWSAKTVGQRIYDAGKNITVSNEKFLKEKFPEQKNFTFADKFASAVGEGTVSLASAIGLGMLAGPEAPAIAFGLSAAASGQVEAKASGKSTEEANKIALALGFAEGGLEFWGVGRLLKIKGGGVKKLVSNAVNGIFTEFFQEFSQTAAEGTIKTATGVREYKGVETLKQIVKDSLFSGAVGAVLGGGAGVSLSLNQRSTVEEALEQAGVPEEKAAELSDQLMKEAIEDTVTAVETLPEVAPEKETEGINSVKDIAKKYETENIDSFISESDLSITLSKVIVPKDQRGSGAGTRFMEDLVAYADSANKTIKLTPSKDFGATSIKRLKDFYKKFGFVENQGRNKDYSISESMYRLAQEVKVSAQENPIAAEIDEADDWEVESEIIPETIKPKKKGLSLLDEKIKAIKDSAVQADIAKESLSWIKSSQKNLRRRIAPYADGQLQEEYNEIPKIYRSKKGIPMDQAADEIGINEAQLAEYLNDLDAQAVRLQDIIDEGKPKVLNVRITELAQLKSRIKDMMQGKRAGEVETKKEVKSLQKELTDLIKGLDIEAKDKAKFLTTIKEVNSVAQLQKQITKVIDRANKFAESTSKRKSRDRIEKELKYTKPVGGKGKYDYLSNKLFDELRTVNKMNQETAQTMLDLMPTENLSETDLIKARMLAYKANGMSGSLELHKQVLADIKHLKHLGKLSKSEESFLKAIERQLRAEEVSEGIDEVKADKNTLKTMIGNLYRKGFSNIYSMLNSVAGKDIAEALDPEIHENKKAVGIFKKTQEITKKIADILELSNPDLVLQEMHDRAAEKYILVDREGLKHEISKMDIIDIYNSMKNEAISERYNNAFGSDQLVPLLENLSDKDMLIGDVLQEAVQSYLGILNKRSIETAGRDLGTVENYWPATSEHAPSLLDDYRSQGETPSAMKARSEGGMIFPIPKNAWLKAMRHISQAEHIDKLSRQFVELKGTFSNRKVKNQIINKFGEDVYKTLMKQIENISLNKVTADIDAVSSALGKIVNNWVTAKIALNPTVFAKQLLSIVNYSENMPQGSWASGFFKGLSKPKETFKYMWENSDGFLEQRFSRGFSEAMNEALEGAKQISKNKYSWTKGLSSWVRAGDISAIVYGGYSYVKHLESTGMTTEQAFEEFKKATLKSQQSGLASGLSQFQNQRNPVVRLFLAFKNTSNQYFRKQADAIISYQNKDISAEQLAKTTLIYSVINPILYAATGKAVAAGVKLAGASLFGAVHDDEEDMESILTDILIQIAVNPFMAIPVLDDISKFAARVALDQPVYNVFRTPMFDDLETALSKMGKDDITFTDYLQTFGTAAEVATGLPIQTSLRYYKMLIGE